MPYRFPRIAQILILAMLTMGLAQPTLADDRIDESVALVDALIKRIETVLGDNPSPATIRSETENVINDFFDFDLVARFAAGQAWRTATDHEKTLYKKAFRRVLLSLAETQIDYLNNLSYTPTTAIAKGDKLVIASGMVHDKTGALPDAQISWRISTKPQKPPRIIDLEVENISLLITQQQENTAIIQKNGGSFQALIDSLNKQADDIANKAKNEP